MIDGLGRRIDLHHIHPVLLVDQANCEGSWDFGDDVPPVFTSNEGLNTIEKRFDHLLVQDPRRMASSVRCSHVMTPGYLPSQVTTYQLMISHPYAWPLEDVGGLPLSCSPTSSSLSSSTSPLPQTPLLLSYSTPVLSHPQRSHHHCHCSAKVL